MAIVMGLVPSGVRLDGYAPRAEPLATYVRLEYGDGGADWYLAGSRVRSSREETQAAPSQDARRRGMRGILDNLASLFQLG